MECRDFAQQLDDLLDGGLDAARQKSIQEHVGRCPDCRRLHEHAVAVRQAAPDAEGGRGLQLVDLLSSAWGTEADSFGKTVWFRLDM